jgi:hypothetical protein
LIKSVTHQVVVGRPSHMADRPCGLASTDFLYRLGLPLLMQTRVMEATGQTDIKPSQPDRGFGRPATPLGPLVNSLYTLPPHVRYIPEVTLILVELQIFL